MQADHAFGAESPGTTAAEAAQGESLDEALAQERTEPEAIDEVLSLVDDGVSDVEGELSGDAVVERDEFASPEEAALSIRENVPGATDHDDPHGDQKTGPRRTERLGVRDIGRRHPLSVHVSTGVDL